VPLPVSLVYVRQAVVLVWQRQQRLRKHRPLAHIYRQLPLR
jgi:hypothetical protein